MSDNTKEPPLSHSVCDNPKADDDSQRSYLLAIDCGLKTGFACFSGSGILQWYRSQNFGSRSRLKKAAWRILRDVFDNGGHLVIEGGGSLAEIWIREAKKMGIPVTLICAEQWRKDLLFPRQQRNGKQAKQVADELAREIIVKSTASKPTSLRHDAAEAILIGWWFQHYGNSFHE